LKRPIQGCQIISFLLEFLVLSAELLARQDMRVQMKTWKISSNQRACFSLDPGIWQCFVVAFQKTAKNVSEYGREHTEPRRTPDSDFVSLRKQPTFHQVATWALAKRHLSNERRKSILMTWHYPDLGSASDWLEFSFNQSEALPDLGSVTSSVWNFCFQPIRSTTKIWVVSHHQYGISALVTQTSFCEGSSGDLVKRQLFSQAMILFVRCFFFVDILFVVFVRIVPNLLLMRQLLV